VEAGVKKKETTELKKEVARVKKVEWRRSMQDCKGGGVRQENSGEWEKNVGAIYIYIFVYFVPLLWQNRCELAPPQPLFTFQHPNRDPVIDNSRYEVRYHMSSGTAVFVYITNEHNEKIPYVPIPHESQS
jgi:hypothetical protein